MAEKFQRFLDQHYRFFITGLSSLYFLLTCATGFARHAALETRAFDLGIFAQAIWATTEGKFLFSSLKGGICLLGDHVSPILAAIAPLYRLWPDPRLLIFLQAAAATCSIILISRIALWKSNTKAVAFVFTLCGFLYYPARAALHEDFHPEVLIEPFFYLSFLFIEKKKWWFAALSLLMLASGKENMLGITFILGFYSLLTGSRRAGILIMISSAVLFILEVNWLVPFLSGQQYFYQKSYQALLGSPLGAQAIFFDPDRWEYVLKVFLPFAFLPFFHLPTLVLTAPILIQNFLSSNQVMRSQNFHYYTGLTPALFISSIYAFISVSSNVKWLKGKQAWLLSGFLFLSVLRSGPSEYYYFWKSLHSETSHKAMIREKLNNIPPSKSVLTHNNFVAQTPNRLNVYQYDYNDADTKAILAEKVNADLVIFDKSFWEPETQALVTVVAELAAKGYRVIFSRDGFFMLEEVH